MKETNDQTKTCFMFDHLDTKTNYISSHMTEIALKLLLIPVALSSMSIVSLKIKISQLD